MATTGANEHGAFKKRSKRKSATRRLRDCHVMKEKGTLCFKEGRFEDALMFYCSALQVLHNGDGPEEAQPHITAAWENICSNLAVTYKKLQQYDQLRLIVNRCLRAPCFEEPSNKYHVRMLGLRAEAALNLNRFHEAGSDVQILRVMDHNARVNSKPSLVDAKFVRSLQRQLQAQQEKEMVLIAKRVLGDGPVDRPPLAGAQSHTIGDKAYIYGGATVNNMLWDRMLVFDLAKNCMCASIKANAPPLYGYQSFKHERRIVYIPAADYDDPLEAFWVFNTIDEVFTCVACHHPMVNLNVWQVNNLLYITCEPEANKADYDWYTFDMDSLTIEPMEAASFPDVNYPLRGVNFHKNNKLYVLGGMVGKCRGRGRPNHHCKYQHTSAEGYCYDLSLDEWREVSFEGDCLPTAMAFSASFHAGSYVLTFGGTSTWYTHGNRLQHVNLFTVTDDQPYTIQCRFWWSSVPPSEAPIMMTHSATGRFLLYGGYVRPNEVSAEIYTFLRSKRRDGFPLMSKSVAEATVTQGMQFSHEQNELGHICYEWINQNTLLPKGET